MTETSETTKTINHTHQIEVVFYIGAVKGEVTINTNFVPSKSEHFDYILTKIKEGVGTNKEVAITKMVVKPLGQKNQEIDLNELLRLKD